MKWFLIINIYAAIPAGFGGCAPSPPCARPLLEVKLPMPSYEVCQKIVAESPLAEIAFCQAVGDE